MTTKTRTKKRPPAAPPGVRLPEAGYWRPTQTLNGKVLQYAWRCPTCKRVEYVLCGDGRKMEAGSSKNERCLKCSPDHGRRIRDDRECRPCTGAGEIRAFVAPGEPVRIEPCSACEGTGLAPRDRAETPPHSDGPALAGRAH